MTKVSVVLLATMALIPPLSAQHPLASWVDGIEIRFARSQPIVSYTLRIDSTDLSGWDVEMRIRNAPDTFRLAMAAHPEYDDRYWRYVEGLRVEPRRCHPEAAQAAEGSLLCAAQPAAIVRQDSSVWRVVAPGGDAVVRYRIRLPAAEQSPRAAWRPFLSPTGGLTGGPHAFMYVLGATLAPAHVKLELPESWGIATGLTPTADPRVFFAPGVHALMESPIFTGRFRSWMFEEDGVPHRVVYWSLPNATPFDPAAFVSGVEGFVRQAVALFGRPPYRDYTFVFQDGAYGGLEHPNMVTLGTPSADLATSVSSHLAETAHEFFHTWNLMRIRPEEYRDVDYRTQPPTAGLWFSEGLTIFYSDLLLRRAGLPVSDSTRIARLERLIARYLGSAGNIRFSAEAVSRVEYNSPPGALGDYDNASSHTVGEAIGTVLDIVIRGATNGERSIDDVMRLMLERFSGERGFNGNDVEQAVEDVCRCDVTPIFDANVRGGGKPIDFDRYLGLIGLRARVSSGPAIWRGEPERDLRIWGWAPPGEGGVRIIISDPSSIWGKAGLHTGDQLVSVNGTAVTTWPDFRSQLGRLRMGDTVHFELRRPDGPFRTVVVVTGFDRPSVRIEEIPAATERQRALRGMWLRGEP